MAMSKLYEGIEANAGRDDKPSPGKSNSDETLLLERLRGARHCGKGRQTRQEIRGGQRGYLCERSTGYVHTRSCVMLRGKINVTTKARPRGKGFFGIGIHSPHLPLSASLLIWKYRRRNVQAGEMSTRHD